MAVSVPRLLAVGVALFAHLIVPFLEILAYNPNGVPDPSVFLNVCEDLTNVTPQHSSNGTLPQQRQKACTIKIHLGVPACTGLFCPGAVFAPGQNLPRGSFCPGAESTPGQILPWGRM